MHDENLFVSDGAQRFFEQLAVWIGLAREFVTEEAIGRPTDVTKSAGLGHTEDSGGGFAAGGAPEGVEMATGHFVEAAVDAAEFFADAGLVERLGFAVFEGDIGDAGVGKISTKVKVAPGMGAELVTVGNERAPEGGPGDVEGGVAAFGFFVGQEECGFDLVFPQDGRDLFGRSHVSSVNG